MTRASTAAIRKALPGASRATSRPRARGSLTAIVTDRLREAIMDGRIRLGETLSEVRLAEALGVSRAPVRDALTQLRIEGLIDVRPQAGSYVYVPSEDDVVELSEFRAILELTALRRGYARQRGEMLRRMRLAVEQMERARAVDDRLAVARADTAFHQAIIECGGNAYLIDAYRLISGRVAALRTHNLVMADTVRKGSLSEHRALVAALSRGDLPRAEGILADHVHRMKQRFQPVAGRSPRMREVA